MNSLTRAIIHQAHPASFVLGCGSVLAGLTASVIRGHIELFPAFMTLLFVVLLQATINLFHGYKLYSGEYSAEEESSNQSRDMQSKKSLMKIFSDAFLILTATAGLPLFSYIGWIGVGYVVVIMVILHFDFSGRKPLIRTPWGLAITFLLFGPIGVSGTALIQDMESANWLPLFSYSIINGLMAVNAHIAVMFAAYKVDVKMGKNTLLVAEGPQLTRALYLLDSILVCILLVARQCVSEIVDIWIGFSLAGALLLSSIWVYMKMKGDPMECSKTVMTITKLQYLLLILVMMSIVIYHVNNVSVSLFQ